MSKTSKQLKVSSSLCPGKYGDEMRRISPGSAEPPRISERRNGHQDLIMAFRALLRDNETIATMNVSMTHHIDRLFSLPACSLTALEIVAEVDEQEIADILVRINSEGIKLDQADFILTLLSVFWQEGRLLPDGGGSRLSPRSPRMRRGPVGAVGISSPRLAPRLRTP